MSALDDHCPKCSIALSKASKLFHRAKSIPNWGNTTEKNRRDAIRAFDQKYGKKETILSLEKVAHEGHGVDHGEKWARSQLAERDIAWVNSGMP